MINKLRRRFIFIVMSSVFAVLIIVIGSINIVNVMNMDRNTTTLLNYIATNNGVFSNEEKGGEVQLFNPLGDVKYYAETSYRTRFFVVTFNPDGSVQRVNTNHIAAVSDETAVSYARQAVAEGKYRGYAQEIYKYMVQNVGGLTRVYFVDINQELTQAASFVTVSFLMAIICYIVITLLIIIFSRKAIGPIIESTKKQKQFITDAGHELKTPLAIISANADVLELTYGENEWITSIHNQTRRMDELVKHLLILSKTDEMDEKLVFNDFSLSDLTSAVVASFEPVAKRAGKSLSEEIQPNISFYGSDKSIRQLLTLLTDNAVKYASDGGEITVRLYKKGRNTIIETENSVPPDYKFDGSRLFDRFYRSDHSRSRDTGGYGIGLSIAAAVVKMHNGTITADCKNSVVKFTVVF